MADFNVEAIVLKRMQYGETDNILTLYSRERGKFSAIAKGARKAISRLSGASELLSHGRYSLASARSLQIIRQAEVIESHSALRGNLRRLANGLYVAELLSHFVTEGDPDSVLFDLLSTALLLVSQAPSPDRSTRWFELQLLDSLGYAPVLTECSYCGITLVPAPIGLTALSASQGGVLCVRHAHPSTNDDHSVLDKSSLTLLQQLRDYTDHEAESIDELLQASDPSDRNAATALRRYLRFRLDHELKSLVFLDNVHESC